MNYLSLLFMLSCQTKSRIPPRAIAAIDASSPASGVLVLRSFCVKQVSLVEPLELEESVVLEELVELVELVSQVLEELVVSQYC